MSSSVDEPVIVARELWRTYGVDDAAVVALRGADLTVSKGEIVAVTGPSGSGKTTLLNCVAGLDLPDEGSVEVFGTRIDELDYEAGVVWRQQHLAIVFQSVGLLPYLTARENVEVGLRLRNVDRKLRRSAANEALERMAMHDVANHRPGELSGGQQQRVAIARALAIPPRLLIADEPTGQLDSDTSALVLNELKRAVAEHELTIVMTTHDPVAEAVADRAVRLVSGALSEDPEVAE